MSSIGNILGVPSMVFRLFSKLPDPGSHIQQLGVGLLEHVEPEVLEALLAPPGQKLHEDVDRAVLEVNVRLGGTLNRDLAQMEISHLRLISVLQGLGGTKLSSLKMSCLSKQTSIK